MISNRINQDIKVLKQEAKGHSKNAFNRLLNSAITSTGA